MNFARRPARRKFLKAAAGAAAAATTSCGGAKCPWRCFTAEEGRALTSVCEQIIPADQDPGAAWAGVANFIDRQLAGHFKEHREVYRKGLREVDRIAQRLHKRKFADLDGPGQIEVLKAVEKSDARAFFDLVIAHAMQGFYGGPRHGGNQDACSWRMLGVPEAQVRGRGQYDLTAAKV